MSKRRPPKPRAPSSHPRGAEDSEDAFIGRVLGLTLWAKQNTQALILGGVILALIVAGSVYYLNFRTATSAQASLELTQIQQIAGGGEIEQARLALEDFLERFGNTRQADEARLMLGEIHLADGRTSEAIAALQPAARSLRNNPIGIQAAQLLGSAYEEAERLEDAEETYLRVANRATLDFQIEEAVTSAARIRVDRGDHAGAESLYQQLIDRTDDDDPRRGIFEMRLAEISAQRPG